MKNRPRLQLVVFFMAALVSLKPGAESRDFTGSESCGRCHQEQLDAWEVSHHDWAFKPPTEEFVLGDFDDASFSHQGIDSRFFRRDGEYFVETGNETGQIHEYKIVHVVGIAPLQQYLVETEPGRLQALDLAWDVEAKHWFHLYPDQVLSTGDGLHWTGPYKNWNSRCAECHQTNFKKNYDVKTESYSSSWSEANVGCESCHGPGQAHIEWAVNQDEPKTASGYDGAALAPDFKASAGAELDVCIRCHSRRSAIDANSPLASDTFDDHYRLADLSENLYFADGQILDEVYVAGSFMQSKMYAKGVTCSNCHDPHSLELKAQGNALCTQCHNPDGNTDFPSLANADYDSPAHHHHEPGAPGAACVSCHMPERTYMQVDPRRDHSFRIPRPDLSISLGTPNACTGCHDDESSEWAVTALESWENSTRQGEWHYGQVLAAGRNIDRVDSPAVDMLIELVSDTTQPAIVRATALDLLQPVVTGQVLDTAQAALSDDHAIVRSAALGLLRQAPAEQRLADLAPLLHDPARTIRIDAASALIDIPFEQIPESDRGALSQLVREYQETLIENSDFPEAQMAIAGMALSIRNPQAAIQALTKALEMDTGLTEAWRLRSRVEWALGDPGQALATLNLGLQYNPDSVRLLTSLAEQHMATNDPVKAIGRLQQALEIEPDNVQSRNMYADLLLRSGNNQRVVEFLYANNTLPVDADGLYLLAVAARARGNLDLYEIAASTLRRDFPLFPLLSDLDGPG